MRAVLDTNVIVSALISRGPPHQLVAAWRDEAFIALISAQLLAEYARVIRRPQIRQAHRLDDEELTRFIGRFLRYAEFVQPVNAISVILSDPDDNRVLECAIAGNATHIVSGDPHLLDLGSHAGIHIVNPRDFLTLLDQN